MVSTACWGLGAPWASWRGHCGLPSLLLIHREHAEGGESEFCFYSSTSGAGDDSMGSRRPRFRRMGRRPVVKQADGRSRGSPLGSPAPGTLAPARLDRTALL